MTIQDTVTPMHLHPGEGHHLTLVTDAVTVKATTDDTGGAFALYETETPPAGGCPPHVQRYDDEALFVIQGRYAVLIGDRQVELGPGGYVFIPRGTVHAFTNPGSEPARMLVLVTPGGIHEQFVAEVSDRAGRAPWEPDMARILAVAPKYGVEFTSPAELEER
jgi:mannose-6-phosphate isomerase-like protein (cupin superfamily)